MDESFLTLWVVKTSKYLVAKRIACCIYGLTFLNETKSLNEVV